MRNTGRRKLVGGVLRLAGCLCLVAIGIVVIWSALQLSAGTTPPAGPPWGLTLALAGAAGMLWLVGTRVIGRRHPATKGKSN